VPKWSSQVIWFYGENGTFMCMDRLRMDRRIIEGIRTGELRRVNQDGSPWDGDPDPFPPEPLPEETIIDSLRGYRYWAMEDDRLVSAHHLVWPAGEWAVATCDNCKVVPSQNACAGYGYGCGLYAASTPTGEIRFHGIWGVIEAKGRIVMHARGFRAEYARVIALARPESKNEGRSGLVAQRRLDARRVALAYGVPLLPAAQLVAEYPPDVG
jgi:hypothetical protein